MLGLSVTSMSWAQRALFAAAEPSTIAPYSVLDSSMPDLTALQQLLDRIRDAESFQELDQALAGVLPTLLGAVEATEALVTTVGTAEDPDPLPERILLERLIDEARMDRENEGSRSQPFFAALEKAIDRLDDEGRLSAEGTFALGQCFAKTGLPVPDRLMERYQAWMDQRASIASTPDHFEDALATLIEEAGDNAGQVYAMMTEMLAMLHLEERAGVIHQLANRPEPLMRQVTLYWLLDPELMIREAAAMAVRGWAAAGPLDGAMAARLVQIRSWLPADMARAGLDAALKEARRRSMATQAPEPTSQQVAPEILEVRASIPDGVDAQTFAIRLVKGDKDLVALALLKGTQGIKDAYVIREEEEGIDCEEAMQQISAVSDLEVDLETVRQALAAGLATSVASGRPPAPGLLELVEACGFDSLRPQAMTLDDWRVLVDPEDCIPAMTPQLRGRRINESDEWPMVFPIVQSWFEDNDAVREILGRRSQTEQERALWAFLETRREIWALRALKSAQLMKATERLRDWEGFVAVAWGLLNGRPLKKIPIMAHVVSLTLEAYCAEELNEGSAEDKTVFIPAPDPMSLVGCDWQEDEDFAFLARVLQPLSDAETGNTLARMDGYLTAVIIGPEILTPNEWLPSLWGDDQPDFADFEEMQRSLAAVMKRYNQILTELDSAPDTYQPILPLNADGQPEAPSWAKGFLQGVRQNSEAWLPMLENAEEAQMIMGILAALASDAGWASTIDLPPEAISALITESPESLPQIVRRIDAFWAPSRSAGSPFDAPPASPRPRAKAKNSDKTQKIGRNDPCPCGSGKKYKKCCGQT